MKVDKLTCFHPSIIYTFSPILPLYITHVCVFICVCATNYICKLFYNIISNEYSFTQ